MTDFLSTKRGALNDHLSFFKSQLVSKNFMLGIVNHVCTALNIYGDSASKYKATHGIRATMMSLLIAPCDSDESILVRSGHQEADGLKSYHNI